MDLREKAAKIKLLAFDVDGVMTTGEVTYDENGVEYKSFNVKDGHGLVRVQNAGFITAIITAPRRTPASACGRSSQSSPRSCRARTPVPSPSRNSPR